MASKAWQEFSSELRSFSSLLSEAGLAIDCNEAVVKSYYDNKIKQYCHSLNWGSDKGLSYLFGDFLTVSKYIEVLNRRDYNYLLSDYSILQLAVTFDDKGNFRDHRYCYLPSPIDFSEAVTYGIPPVDYIQEMDPVDLIDNFRMVTPIRFDFDSEFVDSKHAHSHLTLNKDACRIPGYGPVSLGHFLKFVFRYFYENHFGAIDWEEVSQNVKLRTHSDIARHEFFFETHVK